MSTKKSQSLTRARSAIIALVMIATPVLVSHSPALADRVPPLGGQRSPYPPPFISYMNTNFGRMWMHTVQEEVVRRIYTAWLAKESKDKPKP